ncbi:maleylpyruvate isomerase N-terminal domain-containing protein [Cellulomonas sp. PhB143]|uniref:maleylpyruvate isomerase N-terminal domain-containing protein n=1 Tax=Cellulomonas sp. PhB143 TaxID=2485186 RepID=UPI000F4AF617|nr:maleylpyruvate isomerase N-terminal domain-containing protein [Cellulomonas sp. PhB143]ROS73653.1 MDMPI-like protein [Cellulomonas sp. PhB143]
MPASPDPSPLAPPAACPIDPLAELARAQEAFAVALESADPEAPLALPGCEWRVADLALHLGQTHWWAAAMAVGVVLESADPVRPRDTVSLVRFYRWAAEHLRSTLAGLPAGSPAVTLDGRGPASFWWRRQLHETLVHLEDLRGAVRDRPDGHGPAGTVPDDAAPPAYAASPAVWADAVDEVVTVLHPRQVRLGRTGAPAGSVDLRATDVALGWRIGGQASGQAGAQSGGAGLPADAAVAGPARSLALLLWHRVDLHDAGAALATEGDAGVLDAVLGSALTP